MRKDFRFEATITFILMFCMMVFMQSQTPEIVDSFRLEWKSRPVSTDTLAFAKALNLYGESLAKNRQDDSARNIFLEVLNLYPPNTLVEELGYTANNLGTILSRNNDPGAAIPHIKTAKKIFSHLLGPDHLYIGVITKNEAMQNGLLGNQIDKLRGLITADSTMAFHLPKSHTRRLETLRELAITFERMEWTTQADSTFQLLLDLVRELPEDNHHERLRAFDAHSAHIASQELLPLQARINLFEDYLMDLEGRLGEGHRGLRDIYNNYAIQLSLTEDKLEKSLKYFQKAFAIQYEGVKAADINDSPHFSNIRNPSVADLTLFLNKGQLLSRLFLESKDLGLLQSAFDLFVTGDSIAEQIKFEVMNQDSRLVLKNQYIRFYVLFNTCCHLLQLNTEEDSYVEKIFENIEKMKNWELVDQFSKVPVPPDGQSHINQKIRTLGMQIRNQSLLANNPDSLLKLDLEMQRLLGDHSSLFKLLFGFKVKSYQDVSRYCQENEDQWIHYFYLSPDSIGAFLFTPDTNFMMVLPSKSGTVSAQLDSLQDYVIKKEIDFGSVSHRLYLTLITPLKPFLKKGSLIVTPSSSLRDLPFELLLSEFKSGFDLKQMQEHYLLNSFFIRYQHSGSQGLLTYQGDQKVNNVRFFAPKYGDQKLRLSWNQEEVKGSLNSVKGHNSKSNKTEFIKSLETDEVIHFAGHTITNESGLDSVYLIFEDDSLFMQEVISTNAKSKLMVLSSCKSAVGKPTVEAQMGPAYAFSLAGVPNVVATLWDVSDRESAQLFPLFYKELSSGKSSEEALTLAKRAFLKSAPGPALHPYYWASSVYYGNPLTYESSNVKMYLVIAACFVFLLAGLMIRKRRI